MQKVELEESRVGRTRASGTEPEERREEKLQREELEESKVGRTRTSGTEPEERRQEKVQRDRQNVEKRVNVRPLSV